MTERSAGTTGAVFLDSTAVLALHVDVPAQRVAADAIAGDRPVCACALALTEAIAAVDRLTDEAIIRADLEDAVRRHWDRFHVVPVDQRCLDEALALLRTQPLRLSDAIHLAAATRLPGPTAYVTFDPTQIPVALGLGLDVVSL